MVGFANEQIEDYKNKIKENELYIKKLEHHRDITVGLFATDRPDLFAELNDLLFKITNP